VPNVGQSVKQPLRRVITPISHPSLSVFPTNFGWCGIVRRAGRLTDVLIGHSDADEVRQSLALRLADRGEDPAFDESDRNSDLRSRLERYFLGQPVTFDDIDLELRARTEFRRRVIKVTRSIPFGETITYGELAQLAGYVGAARAAGTVMSTNRCPIIIPCHRVVASNGRLGGYSAPQGIDLKARLLAMEKGAT
jgi:methylated-DNA-[protein]-cysteine S-methyltransferase